jgi:hypothetical protein
MTFYKKPSPNDALVMNRAFVPRSIDGILRAAQAQLFLPMSRLVAVAVDNELDAPAPFTYNIDLPTNEYIELAYIDEAQKIIRYIQSKFPKGVGLDLLCLCRRDLGVPDKERFLFGFRELLRQGMVEIGVPPSNLRYTLPLDYKYVRIKT